MSKWKIDLIFISHNHAIQYIFRYYTLYFSNDWRVLDQLITFPSYEQDQLNRFESFMKYNSKIRICNDILKMKSSLRIEFILKAKDYIH